MDMHNELLKSIDEKVLEKIKLAIEESLRTLSLNVHNVLKLLRGILKYCTGPDNRSCNLKPNKLDLWLSYFQTMPSRFNNIFSDIFSNLELILDPNSQRTMEAIFPELRLTGGRRKAWSDVLASEAPLLKDELAFLFSLVNFHGSLLSGIVKQEQRPGGGMHVVSESRPKRQASTSSTDAAPIALPPSLLKCEFQKISLASHLRESMPSLKQGNECSFE